MKYPVAIVFVLLTQFCFAYKVEKKPEETCEIELLAQVLGTNLDNLEYASFTAAIDHVFNEQIGSVQPLYNNPFSKSQYYELYLLYLNIAVDKLVR